MTIRNPDGSSAKYRVESLKRKTLGDIEKEKAQAKASAKKKAPTKGKKK